MRSFDLVRAATLAWALGACGPGPRPAAPAPEPAPAQDADAAAAADAPPADHLVMSVVGVDSGRTSVVLVDPDGEVFVPIFISESQVEAIDSRLRRRRLLRPSTHDLLDDIIGQLGARVIRVEITRLEASTFIGSVVLRQGDRTLEIDARSSDAIVVSLGERVPVYVARAVVEAAGVGVDDPVETGVADCDRYLSRYLRCVDARASLVDRVIVRTTVRQQGELMRAAVSDEDRAMAAEACVSAEAELEREVGHDACWAEPGN